MATKYVYPFGGGKADGKANSADLLGAKGANLAEMARIGIPAPPGFAITVDVCNAYFRNNGNYPPELEAEVEESLARLEQTIGAKFGAEEAPLILSVRSSAKASMPGMMDTVLNLGLNDSSVQGLAKKTGNQRFAYDSYRRLIQTYGGVVMGVSPVILEEILEEKKKERGARLDTELMTEDLKNLVAKLRTEIREVTGREFPTDPREQLWEAIAAVFKSWNSSRAVAYREINRIPHDLGTAVIIQAMVFGNVGDDSGTGVVFSRDPATGEKKLVGEFLPNAQGEDIVAGIRTPQPISYLQKSLPECYAELADVAHKLEQHFKDMQDIEFTIQNSKLWVLQTRAGKRTAQAAIKISMGMVREKLIDGRDAFLRLGPSELEQVLHPTIDAGVEREVIATGLSASPGAASGKVMFDPEEAVELAANNVPCILVRVQTSADDIRGLAAASGVLTTRGGITSHAAVVARGMGKPCIVGCSGINIDRDREEFVAGNRIFGKGEFITLDGSTGEVISGKLPTVAPKLSDEFKELLVWTDLVKRLGVMANADTPQDARLARDFGAEGIGLCRTEHMFFQADRIDYFRRAILAEGEEERRQALMELLPFQKADLAAIFREMDGLPVTVRLLDPPLHEFLPLPYEEEELKTLAKRTGISLRRLRDKVQRLKEFNPMLGHRGCRLGITFPEIYEIQVRAIMEAAYGVIKEGFSVFPEIMLPFVSHTGGLRFLKQLVVDTCQQVESEMEVAQPDYRIGIMIELPRAVLIADELAQLVDFFSFGTNDLTQTTFGLSRDDAGLFLPAYFNKGILTSDPFIKLDEAGVGELVKMGMERGKKANHHLKVGVCGEHGGDPDSIRFFHQLGLDYVSCSPYRVPIARFAASQAVLTAKADNGGEARW
jgi:pyruvate,orthophosphate dikinase